MLPDNGLMSTEEVVKKVCKILLQFLWGQAYMWTPPCSIQTCIMEYIMQYVQRFISRCWKWLKVKGVPKAMELIINARQKKISQRQLHEVRQIKNIKREVSGRQHLENDQHLPQYWSHRLKPAPSMFWLMKYTRARYFFSSKWPALIMSSTHCCFLHRSAGQERKDNYRMFV